MDTRHSLTAGYNSEVGQTQPVWMSTYYIIYVYSILLSCYILWYLHIAYIITKILGALEIRYYYNDTQ